jgi:hypothetical protein
MSLSNRSPYPKINKPRTFGPGFEKSFKIRNSKQTAIVYIYFPSSIGQLLLFFRKAKKLGGPDGFR